MLRNSKMEVHYLKCRKPLGPGVIDRYPRLQVLDAGLIAGKEHLEYAVKQAEKAFERRCNISGDPLIEPIVRASAQRQIRKALEAFGVKNSRRVYVLCDELPSGLLDEYGCVECEPEPLTRDSYDALKKAFKVGEKEISAVAGREFEERARALLEIIKERIALLEAG